jgi:hypothetical protein
MNRSRVRRKQWELMQKELRGVFEVMKWLNERDWKACNVMGNRMKWIVVKDEVTEGRRVRARLVVLMKCNNICCKMFGFY